MPVNDSLVPAGLTKYTLTAPVADGFATGNMRAVFGDVEHANTSPKSEFGAAKSPTSVLLFAGTLRLTPDTLYSVTPGTETRPLTPISVGDPLYVTFDPVWWIDSELAFLPAKRSTDELISQLLLTQRTTVDASVDAGSTVIPLASIDTVAEATFCSKITEQIVLGPLVPPIVLVTNVSPLMSTILQPLTTTSALSPVTEMASESHPPEMHT